MHPFIEILRPNQWYKNLVIFLAPIFGLKIFDLSLMTITLSGFVLLCLLSGANYIINDFVDRERDRFHPEKKNRPIASGKINPFTALILSIFLAAIPIFTAFYMNWAFGIIILALFFITTIYSLFLKKIAFLDVISLSINFVLRAISGAILIAIEVSPWLILSTFLVALTLALAKRKSEAEYLEEDSEKFKEILKYYTPSLTHSFILIIVSTLVISYSIYCVFASPIEPGLRPAFLLGTAPILYFMIFRFLYLVDSTNISRNPEKVLKDPQMFVGGVLWLFVVSIFLYVF